MTEKELDRLASYFIYFDVHKRYGLSFQRFIEMVERGTWEEWQNIS